MSTSLTATIVSQTQARYQSGQAFSTNFVGVPELAFNRAFTTSNVTKVYFNSYSVTSTPTSIDLTSLTDAFGSALSFSTVKHLFVSHTSTANNLTVGGGTNGLFTTLPFTLTSFTATNSDNGSCLHLTTNITVDGTHKVLTLTASAGTITTSVFVLGS